MLFKWSDSEVWSVEAMHKKAVGVMVNIAVQFSSGILSVHIAVLNALIDASFLRHFLYAALSAPFVCGRFTSIVACHVPFRHKLSQFGAAHTHDSRLVKAHLARAPIVHAHRQW